MQDSIARPQQGPIVRLAFLFCVFACLSGAFFMTVKSPQAAGAAYIAEAARAAAAGRHDVAIEAAFQAVLLNPSNSDGWKVLSAILHQGGFNTLSEDALAIGAGLQQSPDDTQRFYAVPAEFRLSLMSETGAGIQ